VVNPKPKATGALARKGNTALPERFHTGRFGRFVRFGPNGREVKIMKDQIPVEPDEDSEFQD